MFFHDYIFYCYFHDNISDLLCQHIETTCEVIQQHLSSARRRVPRDQISNNGTNSSINLGLDKDWLQQFVNCYQNAVKVAKTLQDLLKNAIQTIITNGGMFKKFYLFLNTRHYIEVVHL